ncbi:response regulator [Mesobacterium sp. TK19101]|uniref:Response regulator n=1 Tax=Mesobacterium hydrothermale TaxID=3111907 RepID=A0ABU6HL78_9RHOB|nr:response regulator [Mesobacterium sp. TK19101]MEC3861920.1 response regulator [Mesobacterium sp. TK19101]
MRCLVVEDDDILAGVLSDYLTGLGHDVTRAATIAAALHCLRTTKFDLLLLDYRLPDGISLPVSEYAAATCPNLRTILLTGSGVFPHGEAATIAPGIDWVLRKPVALADLGAIVDYAALDAQLHPVDCVS